MTRDQLRGESIYSICTRNYSAEGNFRGIINDLERIKKLGVTIIWILPHYEIGKKNMSKTSGSPYSVSDYYSVNSDLGGVTDFKELVENCHKLDLKIIIDVVFNHTSCDSVIFKEHPDWFIKDINENYTSKIQHRDDIYDLDFTNVELKKYLIDVLIYWANLGVDGFRFDLAAIIPLSFWTMAKDILNKDYKDLIWFGESVDKEFISFIRHKGHNCLSDSELYNVFDILYDYDVQKTMELYIKGEEDFTSFIKEIKNQEVIYPIDYLKLRFLETPQSELRAAELLTDYYRLINWKAFSIFEKGVPLINSGEEFRISRQSMMDDIDKIEWKLGDVKYNSFITNLLHINHMHIVTTGIYTIHSLTDDCVHIRYRYEGETLHGIFNFGPKDREIKVEVLKGEYFNLISNNSFSINNEQLNLNNAPFIFKSIP